MTYEAMQNQISAILEKYAPVDIYISPDFQCDQTGGFPTSLCVCFEKGMAWLELNENLIMDRDETELEYYRQLCADFGIRNCCDKEQFNELLKELGEDAYHTAYLPDEEEGIGMGGEYKMELAMLIIGLLLGGCIAVALLCCIQINRICDYESEIQRLRKN